MKIVLGVFELRPIYVRNCGVTIVGGTTLGEGAPLTKSLTVQKNEKNHWNSTSRKIKLYIIYI